ncbi:CDGSH iron-sulfur domain-containing protein [Streptomyces sp. TLI_171]|uniref:CDGSH iron-sulfur domain-containing protein n=1 Tax=Streptomyces sp. TLI_171 TaxID=1938859 RepID=UPI000C184413|nr:CDGSH iron-sulfur domain-containing protein [Streptomyces sp. TLI_171]RKE17496.1 iron-binding CDGSH zinc finger protein [Streptomyces sp. TLI_171]
MSTPDRPPTRVRLTERGPLLIDGPVDLLLPDGTELHCDRPVVAVCTCRRSHRYPLCDTSHRRRGRTRGPDPTTAVDAGAPPFPSSTPGQTPGRAQ